MTKGFEQVTLLTDEVVSIPVDIGRCTLYKGYEEAFGLPVENFVMLYAVLEGEIVAKISSPADLSSIVPGIKSRDEAIAFLDLFTSPMTHFLFPAYKNTINLIVLETEPLTFPGAISEEMGSEMGLRPDVAQEISGQFILERNRVTCSKSEICELFRTKESLDRTGDYSLISKQTLGHIPRWKINFPEYE